MSIQKLFEEKFHYRYNDIINQVYHKQFPNRFLASFCTFISEEINHEQLFNLVKKSFIDFVHIQLFQYKNIRNYPLGFIGSIAYYFQDILKEVLGNYSINVSKIIQEPSTELLGYYKSIT